jgi:glycosyltransferase involved in cell wall biosynthesis
MFLQLAAFFRLEARMRFCVNDQPVERAVRRVGGVLFITEEIFLPHHNGSSRIYSAVADRYAGAGWSVFCLSFYRNAEQPRSPAVRKAYAERFQEFQFVPGWNLGGGLFGKAALALRELERCVRGNVLPTHPFLRTRRPEVQRAIVEMVRRNDIDVIYFHKPHALQLMLPVLGALPDVRMVLDLHDDFISRGTELDRAFQAFLGALPFTQVLAYHRQMYLRYHLGRTEIKRSRRRELALLRRCHEVCISSECEYRLYSTFPELEGKVRYCPWPLPPMPRPSGQLHERALFDAGFVGADSIMNLYAVIFFRDEILPKIRRVIPDFRMLLAGSLSSEMGSIVGNEANIEVWQVLPDVEDFYGAIRTALVPLRHGTGVSVKTLEAISYGCPIISTAAGVRGLTQENIQCGIVDVADSPSDFAETVVRRTLERRLQSASASAAAAMAAQEAIF